MSEHPGRISTSYSRQFSRPEDRLREEEEEARRERLTNYEPIAAGEHPVDEWNATFDAAVARYAPETDEGRPDDEQVVNSAIDAAVQQAAAEVEQASMTGEQRLARAIADELRPTVAGITTPGPRQSDDEDEEDELAALEAELAEPDAEPTGYVDENGREIYRDVETGDEFVWAPPDEAA